jgi:thioredoxin 1
MKYYYFTAEWCGPCKAIRPQIAASRKPLTKIDIDSNRDMAAKFGVRSIPTIVGVDDSGNVVENYNGSDSILSFLNR